MSSKDNTSIQKKKRSANWLDQDKALLQDLVRERVRVIENKDSDTNTNSQKQKAWLSIQENFNNICTGESRTISQLRTQWGIIKMVAKKEIFSQRTEIFKTGGGPPPVVKPTSSADISAWLPGEFAVDYNEFDSDINEVIQVETLYSDYEAVDDEEQISPLLEAKAHVITPGSPTSSTPKRSSKLQRKRKMLNPKEGVAEAKIKKIADFEVECRKEIHSIQMENERRKARNLDAEYELIMEKLKNEKKFNKP